MILIFFEIRIFTYLLGHLAVPWLVCVHGWARNGKYENFLKSYQIKSN